jgi:hypothetical protein
VIFLGYPDKKPGGEAMLSKIARGAILFILAVMIAAWAMSAGKADPPDPSGAEPVWRVFS